MLNAILLLSFVDTLLTRTESYTFGVVISPVIVFLFCDFSVLKLFGLFLPSGKHVKHCKIVFSIPLLKHSSSSSLSIIGSFLFRFLWACRRANPPIALSLCHSTCASALLSGGREPFPPKILPPQLPGLLTVFPFLFPHSRSCDYRTSRRAQKRRSHRVTASHPVVSKHWRMAALMRRSFSRMAGDWMSSFASSSWVIKYSMMRARSSFSSTSA